MIIDTIVIKLLGGELPDTWMHSILYLEHRFLISTLEQSFEQRSAVMSLVRVLAESGCWQLILISNKDYSFRAELKRNER